MNIYIVREQDMERVEAFTSRRRAVRYLYYRGYHPRVETDRFELWGRDYNQPERGSFRAYLEEKELVGANHNYKYECKQLRTTLRYLHRKIDKLQNQLALLRAQAEAWQRRARQLKGDNLMLHDKVEMLQRRLARYRHKVTVLKEENEHLREKLAEKEGER